MKKKRIPIPRGLKRQLLVECGHKCSVHICPLMQDFVYHHINFKPSDNRIENVIVFCPNHAAMADKGKIDRVACRMYKKSLKELQAAKSIQVLKNYRRFSNIAKK